jgi:hypothetical protein
MNTPEKKEEEKIVPLYEDLNGHKQNDDSFQKAMNAKEKEIQKAKEDLNKSK